MKKFLFVTLLALPMLVLTNCSSDDDNTVDPPTEVSRTYQLGSVADPNISGTAKVIKNDDDSITVELQLSGTPAGGMHPAHIHYNTAAETGGIAITLGTVDGDTGFSTVTFTALDDSTAISYDDLLAFDGYINVHLSATDLGTLVAQGDIGQNELTGRSTEYALNELDVLGINGVATFYERNNGEALAVLDLNGTPAGGEHPAHIHAGDVANAPGGIIFTFNSVIGDTGISKTNVANLDDSSVFRYNDVIDVDGYINVHLSASELGTIVAQGNVGQNAVN